MLMIVYENDFFTYQYNERSAKNASNNNSSNLSVVDTTTGSGICDTITNCKIYIAFRYKRVFRNVGIALKLKQKNY